MTTLKKILVPAFAVLLGCAVGASIPVLRAQQAGTQQPVGPTSPQTWAYECDPLVGYGNFRPFNAMLNARAQQGWDVVGFAGEEGIACFRRRR